MFKRPPLVLAMVLVLVGTVAWVAVANRAGGGSGAPIGLDERTEAQLLEAFGKLPLRFEPNVGQTDPQVDFLARGHGYVLFLTAAEAVMVFEQLGSGEEYDAAQGGTIGEYPGNALEAPQAVVRMQLVGASDDPSVTGQHRLPGVTNYFVGDDPLGWRTGVPQFAEVGYEGVYPGIDLVFHGRHGSLEYDFVVSPGSDPAAIELGFEGVEGLDLDASGNLVLRLPFGEVLQGAPTLYQVIDGRRTTVAGGYVLSSFNRVGFRLGPYDASRPLIIDPTIRYSTFLGSREDEDGHAITVDAQGNAYITGDTCSVNFPTESPFQASSASGYDAYVTKLSPDGSSLVYSTYLGGDRLDAGSGIVVDGGGNAYVSGATLSSNFPTMNPIQPNPGGGSDAFVAKLAPSGSALLYSTYLGGTNGDNGTGIAIDASGGAYVVGQTKSTNFPVASALQPATGGRFDAFVARLTPAGTALAYSTYLGGGGDDSGRGIAVDGSGNAYVTGQSRSRNFPVRGAFQSSSGGVYDAFVSKLGPTGTSLVYSTYLGGSGNDVGNGIAVDASGSAYVAGTTPSTNFPTAGALQGALGGGTDAFVTKLQPSGAALAFSTFLGGSDVDEADTIVVDGSGSSYVVGMTMSTNFPIANAVQGTNAGLLDVFVSQLGPSGSAFVYSTYVGGTEDDEGLGIALDAAGAAYITGETESTDLTTTAGAFQGVNMGRADGFVMKIA